jgi:phage terminase small subunit
MISKRQKQFVNEYLVDRNATAAAKRAGYAEGSAHNAGCVLMKKPEIMAAIQKKEIKICEKLDLSVEKIISQIEDVRKECMANQDYRAALKALEMLGRHIGMWREQIDVNVKSAHMLIVEYLESKKNK